MANPVHHIVTGLVAMSAGLRRAFKVGESLRERAIRGGIAVLAGEAYANFARLAANLIMTRLLYPEAFGLMLIVNLFMGALGQLSDVGVQQAIIAKRDGIDDRYLDTAWTMLVARGLALAALVLALAYPISLLYGEAQLVPLLVLVSLVPIIRSVSSPYPILFEKEVRPTRFVVVNACAVTGSLVITILWLLLHPTIYALAANGIFFAIISTTLSYRLFPSRRPRLHWDKEVALQIFRFGRWILLGTALTFLARQGDRIIISNWVPAATLGIFSIAVNLSRLLEMLIGKLNFGVLLPVYAELRAGGAGRVSREAVRIKLAIYALCFPVILILAIFGRDIIRILYDERYYEAGWMLEVLAVGTVFFAAGSALHTIPLSFGDSYRHMWRQGLSVAALTLSMLAGGFLAGFPGLIIGSVVAQALDYVIIKAATIKYGVRDYAADTLFIALSLLAITSAWAVRGWPWRMPV